MPVPSKYLPSESFIREQLGKLPPAPAAATDPLSGLTPKQAEVLASTARFKALLCGRRAGKTDLIDRDLATGLKTAPESESLFMSLTTESAKANMWRPLMRLDRKYSLGLRFDHAKMTVTNPRNHAVLQVRGSETLRDLERPRGNGYFKIRLDECGAWRPTYLEYALREVLMPAMMDRTDSTIWLAGTPGRVAVGPFLEITEGKVQGWDVHKWTARDNPHVDYQRFIFGPCLSCETQALECKHGILAQNNWTEDSPAFRREYLAEWVIDGTVVVYQFSRERNVIAALPELVPGDQWQWAMGCDFGVGDATACYVICWPRTYGRGVYVVDGWSQSVLAPSDAVPKIRETYDRFTKLWGKPQYLVGDVNGMGKAYQAEWNKHHKGIEMRAARKQDKRGTLEHVSDALYTGNFSGDITQHRGLACLAHLDRLQRQWATLQWDDERKDIAEGQDDDDADAVMYVYKHSPAFLNPTRVPAPPPKVDPVIADFLKATQQSKPGLFRGHFRTRR